MNVPVPTGPARWCTGAAVATWLGVIAGLGSFVAFIGCAVLGVLGALGRWKPTWVLAGFCALGMVSGLAAVQRLDAIAASDLSSGRTTLTLRVAEEPTATTYGLAVAEILALDGAGWNGPRIAVRDLPGTISVGSTVVASGVLSDRTTRLRDEMVAGTFAIDRIRSIDPSPNPIVAGGNKVRQAVRSRYDGAHRSDGLLSGFLTGDTDRMYSSDAEALRLAGLSHFVAVSGSNVALFLGIWWVVTAPVSMHPKPRAIVGGIGLLLFAVVTRWEPSVIRASVMAAVPLVGGIIGIPIDPWMALGIAVTVLLLVSGHLAVSVGFALSVFATGGVLVGLSVARGRTPRWLFVPLLSTMGAQAAVAPLLLVVFGTVPLLAPVTNLIAAPLVGATTFVAALGVVFEPAAVAARVGASSVLAVARSASFGPQLGPVGAAVAAAAAASFAVRRLRLPVLALALVAVVGATPWSTEWPIVATLTVLNVGQGDAILIQTPDGSSLLMDGGPDPGLLDRSLRKHGVRTVDTVVVSHGDFDHIGGLIEFVAEGRAGVVVASAYSKNSEVAEIARMNGTPVSYVRAGDRLSVGGIEIKVLSPSRRYASDNDGSVILFVLGSVTVLLPGDAESIAQRALAPIKPDVMVVPHHGSATTDLSWLEGTLGDIAILSYGTNRYGHPHPDVVEVLDTSRVDVRSTAIDGDVSVELGTRWR